MVKTNNKIKLQGHEKFSLREGWINKAFIILRDIQNPFTRKDAPDLFGIGNNMVKSLRYWMRALGLTNDLSTELTEFGKIIEECDPYLEKDFTWWLLHANIAKNIENATTWYMFFNYCDTDNMDKNEIFQIVNREVAKYARGTKYSEKSLMNDIDVLLNMYSKKKELIDPEDKNISPFSKLELIKNYDSKFTKNHPDLKKFPKEIVLIEICNRLNDKKEISIEELSEGLNGLAKIYNLTSVMINEILDRLDAEGYIRVNRTAGMDMIYPINITNQNEIIRNYYNSK